MRVCWGKEKRKAFEMTTWVIGSLRMHKFVGTYSIRGSRRTACRASRDQWGRRDRRLDACSIWLESSKLVLDTNHTGSRSGPDSRLVQGRRQEQDSSSGAGSRHSEATFHSSWLELRSNTLKVRSIELRACCRTFWNGIELVSLEIWRADRNQNWTRWNLEKNEFEIEFVSVVDDWDGFFVLRFCSDRRLEADFNVLRVDSRIHWEIDFWEIYI